MAGDRDQLLGMGFEAARVDWALRATGNAGLQPALDFLFVHTDDPIPQPGAPESSFKGSSALSASPTDGDEDEEEAEALRAALGKSGTNVAANAEGAAEGAGAEAKSIKCSECGKIFKNTALANFHAEKSGHDQFEESAEEVKPLTEEEKKQKLADLRAKLAEKRSQKSVQEAEEARANAAIRRKADKEASDAREALKQKESVKLAEQIKREKDADKKARAEILKRIEQDKQERREKQLREKALKEGTELPPAASALPAHPATSSTTSGIPASEYPETRLQLRLASGGKPYVTTLPSDSPLRAVAEFLAAQSLSVDVDTVKFTMQYPRKQFTQDDLSKTLRELGLTPSAVLIAS